MMRALQPSLIAMQFLTRLPVRTAAMPTDRAIGRSLLYYPLVGLILGLLLALFHTALIDVSATLRAALLLALWIALTGALHLDGLADSADAWIGGFGDRKRTLAIMKDPYCGPTAVVTLVAVLLIKFAALQSLTADAWLLLAIVPVLARSAIPLLFLTTPYVRPGGLGAKLARHFPRTPAAMVVAATWLLIAGLAGTTAVWLLLATGGVFLLLRAMMQRRLGGTTGDTAGATVELIETAALVTIALS